MQRGSTYRTDPSYWRRARAYRNSLLVPWGDMVIRLVRGMIARVPEHRAVLAPIILRVNEDLPHGTTRANLYGARMLLDASCITIRDGHYREAVAELCGFHQRFIEQLNAIDQDGFNHWYARANATIDRCLGALSSRGA